MEDLLVHPKLGASWEGFALEETIRALELAEDDVYFWAVHGEAELDLLAFVKGKRHGFEFKYADAPKLTREMRTAVEILKLDSLAVVYPGSVEYELDQNTRIIPLGRISEGTV
jgi:predicted AAA+ superfamily ATPase